MLTKALQWLDWHTRIWFIDNVWTRIFPPDETPREVMTGAELKAHRKRFGLTPKAMAQMLHVDVKDYLTWENCGLMAPHDKQGPVSVTIKVIANILNERKEQKEMLDTLGYKGKMD
jgi:DNA-binding XRE family transcriptional regulator